MTCQKEPPTHIYEYDTVDGHITVKASGQRFLIDTGAPSSVAATPTISFASGLHQAETEYLGASPASLSAMVGTRLDGLIGSDILNNFDVLFDPVASEIRVSEGEIILEGEHLPLDEFMGIPIVSAMVDGEPIRMFFDTGARLSYLDPEIAEGYPSVGSARDFYPTLGIFTTETYEVFITLGSIGLTLKVGVLPDLLRSTLMMAGTSAILGTAVFERHAVGFAPRRKTLTLARLGEDGG